MRIRSLAVAGVACAVWGLTAIAAAQTVARLTIDAVTLQDATGVLTISGAGFGMHPTVIVDGQPVIVLPGGTDARIEGVAPATVLATPGSYRLTVVDAARQGGDAFVVVSQAARVLVAGTDPAGTRCASDAAPACLAALAAAPRGRAAPGPPGDGLSANLIEGPTNTAVGLNALASNTTGSENTAIGAAALGFNTTGSGNAASGAYALRANTTGYANTATGEGALVSNTTGNSNTASGSFALASNTTGVDNTATGKDSLWLNTTGAENTAHGAEALRDNTTGYWNTASGARALVFNTTGIANTASGYQALAFNRTGAYNLATGHQALRQNDSGEANTASGVEALLLNTSGHRNTATGYAAIYTNTTGADNTASGYRALRFATGDANTALGSRAGSAAAAGSYNLFLGADVVGTPADTNTIRIGLPYSAGVGQNQTFIAGIHGAQVANSAVQVFVDANGQLGTITPTGLLAVPPALLQQLQEQQATIDDLRVRLARLEALVRGGTGRR